MCGCCALCPEGEVKRSTELVPFSFPAQCSHQTNVGKCSIFSWYIDLGLLASRTVRNKFLPFKLKTKSLYTGAMNKTPEAGYFMKVRVI
jgi:hypothetical protein